MSNFKFTLEFNGDNVEEFQKILNLFNNAAITQASLPQTFKLSQPELIPLEGASLPNNIIKEESIKPESVKSLILSILANNEPPVATRRIIKDVSVKLPNETPYSIRKELTALLRKGLVKKVSKAGNLRTSSYALKDVQVQIKKKVKAGFVRPNYGVGKEIKSFFKTHKRPVGINTVLIELKHQFPALDIMALSRELDRHARSKNIILVQNSKQIQERLYQAAR